MGVLTETEEERRQMEAMRTGEPVDPPTPAPTPEPAPPPAVPRTAEPVSPPRTPAPQPPPRREVEHGAFHAERERRRELERELAELRAERAAAAARRDAAPPPRPPIPDPQQDPIGSMQHMQQRIAEFEERDRRMAAEQERQREEAERFRAVQKRVQPRIDAYMAEHPEYADQVTYVRNARGRELMRLGASRQEAEQTVIAEEMQLLRLMDERELDPGELISGLAQDRGWRPGQSIAPPGQGHQAPLASGNGSEPPPRARVTPSAADRIERGRQAARSSTGVGGGGAPPEMTVERLAELDGAEFDKAFALHAKRLIG